jgi:DNA polymerase V
VPQSDFTQLDLFADPEADSRREAALAQLQREKRRQQAVLTIKKRFGKNAIVKGMNLEDGATAMDRNGQIGGHKA